MPKNNQPKLFNYWPALLLALLPGLLAIALFVFVYLPMAGQQNAEQRSKDMALATAAMLDNSLQQLADHLDGIARLPDLRLAMRDSNEGLLTQMTGNFELEFTHLNRIALFPLGELGVANLGKFNSQLKNNIEKDMLRRAADNESMLLDSYQLGGQQVLSLARPVYAGDRSIGAILLTLNASWLTSQLDRQQADGLRLGITELIYQVGGGTPVRIVGANSTAADAAVGSATLASNPNIQVNYFLAGSSPELGTPVMIVIGLLLAVALLACLAVRMVFTGMLANLANDIDLLKRSFADSAASNTATAYHYSAFESLGEAIASLSTRLGTAEASNKQAAVSADDSLVGKEVETSKKADKDDLSAWANPQVAGGILLEDDEDIAGNADLASHIFRAYDIRGNADTELSDEVVHLIGLSIGSTAQRGGQNTLVVGRDGRLSSSRIQDSLTQGLLASGCDVIDIGLVATPMLYFAAESLQTQAGVMVTGSHNAPEVNGFKIVLNGCALAEQQIIALAELISTGNFESGKGVLSNQDIVDSYIDQIAEDVVVASSIKVVLDCGNGAASEIAPMLYASLGCEVIPLFAEVDGNFPNHSPDPGVKENLDALINEVKNHQADLGIAFDGDADRMVAVTASGDIVSADQLLMLFAKDVLTRNPGADVVYDIKCSRHLNQLIASHGGRPVMWKSGHSLIKQKMRETGALLGGEFTGHYFFKERWYGFDDGLYSGTRLIEFLTLEGASLDDLIAELPSSFSTDEIKIPVSEDNKFAVIDMLQGAMNADDGQLTTLDGVRVDYAEGWGLVRASNTSASLNARFEANTEEALADIQAKFSQALSAIDPELGTF